jgi:mitochondrial fission protein ELM1
MTRTGEPDFSWVLTPGEPGMRSQALGLAEAVGLPIVEKRSSLRLPWSLLPGGIIPMPLSALDADSDPLSPPWPRLIVACGRRAIGPALAVKRLSAGRTIAAYVQNPEFSRRRFDLVAAMPHDKASGQNVIIVPTALNRVTPGRLAEAHLQWRGRLGRRGVPLLGVLLGGDNSGYRLAEEIVAQLIHVLERVHEVRGFDIVVTPSRRTGEAAKRMLAEAFRGKDWASLWDESGENPYFGILALSDRLIVTAESISMISEALAAGPPVHILRLAGWSSRHEAFLVRVVSEQLVSPIDGTELDWSFDGCGQVNATPAVAARLRAMLGLAP